MPNIVAIVGATGAVGEEIVEVLRRRNFPLAELRLYASKGSVGKVVDTPLGPVAIEEFTVEKARTADLVFFATTGPHALTNAPLITANNGPVVVDNSSAFRYVAHR